MDLGGAALLAMMVSTFALAQSAPPNQPGPNPARPPAERPLPATAESGPVAAESGGATAESMTARASATYGPLAPQRPKACGTQDKNGEIVVCAPGDGKQWRIPSTTDSDPNSRHAT